MVLMLHLLEMIFGICILCLGSVLGIIAGIGQTTSTSVCYAASLASGLSIGSVMMLLYSSFLVFQLLILRKNFHPNRLLQLIPVLLQGKFLDFFRYKFLPLQKLHPNTYHERLIVFVCALLLISAGFSVLKSSDFISFPPESFCYLISDAHHIRFGTCKIFLDIAYVITALGISTLFHLESGIIREGTIFFAIFNGILINFYTPKFTRLFNQFELFIKKNSTEI